MRDCCNLTENRCRDIVIGLERKDLHEKGLFLFFYKEDGYIRGCYNSHILAASFDIGILQCNVL